jgi:GrpB-like predicted nucleotidyltransferase (UPF0157 family)
MADPIIVVPYDPQWVQQFRDERERIEDAFDGFAAEIIHIGSTSVPGLAAKPIIDIAILVDRAEDAIRCITPLVRLGYKCFGEAEIPGRIYFDRREYDPVHIHLYVRGNPEIERHLIFCEYLRAHPNAAQTYAELKYDLANKFRNDREMYTNGKSDFVTTTVEKARIWRGDLI